MRGKRLTIGIDLGGTKIATGLVDASGRLLASDRRPSKDPGRVDLAPREQIRFCVDSMADAVLAVLETSPGKTLKQKTSGVVGVGLAAAGPLNVEKGQIVHPANFENWGVVPVVRLLAQALRKRGVALPVHFQNDAIAAALGEGWVGLAKKATSYAMITLGTGVGTGVILNGKPAQSKGMGSEWGHIIVDWGQIADDESDPYLATAEGYASGSGFMRQARKLGYEVAGTVALAQAARDGDKTALEIFERASRALAALFHNLSIGFNLDVFVVTGGLLPIQDLYVPRAIELYKAWIANTAPGFVAPVKISKLGNKAGVIGAARLPLIQ